MVSSYSLNIHFTLSISSSLAENYNNRNTSLTFSYVYLTYLKDDENPMAWNKKQILDKIRLRGTVAVNLRPATKIEVTQYKYYLSFFFEEI